MEVAYPGLRSRTRFSLGYNLAGFQPFEIVKIKVYPESTIGIVQQPTTHPAYSRRVMAGHGGGSGDSIGAELANCGGWVSTQPRSVRRRLPSSILHPRPCLSVSPRSPRVRVHAPSRASLFAWFAWFAVQIGYWRLKISTVAAPSKLVARRRIVKD